MNTLRNEMTITLGGEQILLRPTFENIAAMEANVGGVSYLGWKFSRGIRLMSDGKTPDPRSFSTEEAARALPTMVEVAQIIYYNQASTKPEDPNQKKYSLDDIWNLLLKNGSGGITRVITVYLAKLTAGDRLDTVEDLTTEEKKS